MCKLPQVIITMASSYYDRDLALVPKINFTFVEDYIKSKRVSSGEKSIDKGFKYYSETYVHDLRVQALTDGCRVTGKCHRSQEKNEDPYDLEVSIMTKQGEAFVAGGNCSCPIGLSEACGHLSGLLYQVASYKMLGTKVIPEDIAKTSLPQTHHIPRGEKIAGKPVQELHVCGYSRTNIPMENPKTVKSTLYNPVRGEPVDWFRNRQKISNAIPGCLVLPALQNSNPVLEETKFGKVPRGSVLSYQQKLHDDYIINIPDGVGFPHLPVTNVMENTFSTALTAVQITKLEGLNMSLSDVNKFEEQTRLQSRSPLWYRTRRNRVTASNIGDIFKRKRNEDTLVTRLKSTRHVTTAAMRQGLASEPIAAREYSVIKLNQVNLYPCGVIVSPWAPWIAATPDRKVYMPERSPAFGLLEIKCPQVTSVLEATYLMKDINGSLKLKRNHNYYFQILCQLAVTGLEWCDFIVWCRNDHHLETIYFNKDLWRDVKNKIDQFYFNFFL